MQSHVLRAVCKYSCRHNLSKQAKQTSPTLKPTRAMTRSEEQMKKSQDLEKALTSADEAGKGRGIRGLGNCSSSGFMYEVLSLRCLGLAWFYTSRPKINSIRLPNFFGFGAIGFMVVVRARSQAHTLSISSRSYTHSY